MSINTPYLNQSGIAEDTDDIQSVWNAMDGNKGDIEDRSEEYARLTIPSICPEDNSQNEEVEKSNVQIGPRIVSFLANKIVNVMFPHDRPFFSVELGAEAEYKLSQEVAQEEIDASKVTILETGNRIAKLGMAKLNPVFYRPVAVMAVKHLIITGNAVIRRMDDGKRIVYGIKDMGVYRELDGTVYDLILRDTCRVDGLPEDIQDKLTVAGFACQPNTIVQVFSRWRKKGKRWEFSQAVESVKVIEKKMIAEKDVDFIVLTWTIARGENYGRGEVENNIAAFSCIDVSQTALLDMFGIAADIKFLINPSSALDAHELINSPRGSYHIGEENAITSPNISVQKGNEMKILYEAINNWEQRLSQTFLMTSGSIRDAERVTAEEIRFYANEIESAFGGLYSSLSMVWQYEEAQWAIRQVGKSIPEALDVVISTGLDALSKESQLQALQQSLNDLALLNGVPEDVRGVLSSDRIARFIFANRNLPFGQFMLSQQEMQAQQEAQAQAQQQQMDMETQSNVQTAAAQEAAKQG